MAFALREAFNGSAVAAAGAGYNHSIRILSNGIMCKMVMLSPFVALSVSLTPKASLLQGRHTETRLASSPAGGSPAPPRWPASPPSAGSAGVIYGTRSEEMFRSA